MTTPPFIPVHKSDYNSIEILRTTEFDIWKPYVKDLLVWLQDLNWPIANPLSKILSVHLNQIKLDVIEVLQGNDDIWKYWCISGLIESHATSEVDDELIIELQRIVNSPSKGELEEEVNILAAEVLTMIAEK